MYFNRVSVYRVLWWMFCRTNFWQQHFVLSTSMINTIRSSASGTPSQSSLEPIPISQGKFHTVHWLVDYFQRALFSPKDKLIRAPGSRHNRRPNWKEIEDSSCFMESTFTEGAGAEQSQAALAKIQKNIWLVNFVNLKHWVSSVICCCCWTM